jgi:GGDEF domain-containing protein
MTKLSLLVDVADDDRRLLLQQIAELIARAKQRGLPNTVFLLNMAYLDLQTNIHDINDEELEAFSRIVRSTIEPH